MHTSAIRLLERRDLDRVGFLVDANSMFPSDMLAEMTAGYFAGEPGQQWLVHDTGAVEAVCTFAPEELADNVWNLLMIAVDPARHGSGLGSGLMREVETHLADEGARILLVDTSGTPEFARTRRFYDQLGYEREARIRDYWAEGDDKVTFRKRLG